MSLDAAMRALVLDVLRSPEGRTFVREIAAQLIAEQPAPCRESPDDYLTIPEASQTLGISPWNLRKRIARGQFPAESRHGRVWVRRRDVRR